MTFFEKLKVTSKKNNSLLCIGLDPDPKKLPEFIHSQDNPIFLFNKTVIDATHDLVCCYKPNIAFYSALGEEGVRALVQTVAYIKESYSHIPVLLDSKRGDIGNTAEKYVVEAFDIIGADAVTVNPYMGFDTIEPFFKRTDKGIFVLCRTSNPGAGDLQDLEVDGQPLYLKVAQVATEWQKTYNNCCMVVGATWSEQLAKVREVAPTIPVLVPGIGSQGGDLENTLKSGLLSDGTGLLINVSRAIIYPSIETAFEENVRNKALVLRDTINNFR